MAGEGTTSMSRIVMLTGFAPGLIYFRQPLLRALVAAGHEVIAAAPDEDDRVAGVMESLGVQWMPMAFDRNRVRPLRDADFLRRVRKMLRRIRPDRLVCATLKPNIYGGWAASAEGVPSAAMVTGIGTVLMNPGWRRRAATVMFRRACRHHDVVLVQNPEDGKDLIDLGIVDDASKIVQTAGEGIDLNAFPVQSLPEAPVFLMLARLLVSKGVREYLIAARRVREMCPTARVQLAGIEDPGSGGVPISEIHAAAEAGDIEYLGFVEDVPAAIAASSVIVLPSWHEGTPHSLLEGMAMGRPVVTTDVRGSRQTVDDGETGLLVPLRDPEALAQAMALLASDAERRAVMGAAGRRLAEDRFDAEEVAAVTMKALHLS